MRNHSLNSLSTLTITSESEQVSQRLKQKENLKREKYFSFSQMTLPFFHPLNSAAGSFGEKNSLPHHSSITSMTKRVEQEKRSFLCTFPIHSNKNKNMKLFQHRKHKVSFRIKGMRCFDEI